MMPSFSKRLQRIAGGGTVALALSEAHGFGAFVSQLGLGKQRLYAIRFLWHAAHRGGARVLLVLPQSPSRTRPRRLFLADVLPAGASPSLAGGIKTRCPVDTRPLSHMTTTTSTDSRLLRAIVH